MGSGSKRNSFLGKYLRCAIGVGGHKLTVTTPRRQGRTDRNRGERIERVVRTARDSTKRAVCYPHQTALFTKLWFCVRATGGNAARHVEDCRVTESGSPFRVRSGR